MLPPKLAYDLSQRLKWPHTLEEWQFMDEVSTILTVGNTERIYATSVLTHYPWGNALGMVLVDPSAQKIGLGTAITEFALSLAQPSKSESVVLTASHDAERLYQKLGFKRVGSVIVLKGKGAGKGNPSSITCSARDISREFYQGCTVREEILKKIIASSPNNYCVYANDGRVAAFASSIRRVSFDGQKSLALGPILLRQPDSIVQLLEHFSQTSNVALTCFVFSRFDNEDDRTKGVRSKIITEFNSQGFVTADELQFMSRGRMPPPLYTDGKIVSPMSLAFG